MSATATVGPIIVTALFGPGDDGWLQQLRRTHYPAGRNRVPAHLTLFHHLPPTLEAELSAAIARIQSGRFVPTPSEFACSDCPALDVVCAGPRLRRAELHDAGLVGAAAVSE